ncbi:MAG: AcrB/AcrD/AcrF family protein [Gemmatimonas sp.]|nr:AcrB/AcrD/AcrF family protein [Gemmatimonas sp.]
MTESNQLPAAGGEEPPKKLREFKLTSFALGSKISVLVLLAIISIMGIISYRMVPKEANPEITMPMVAVNTSYMGVSPGDMETLVTRVIEDELNEIADLETLTSTTVEGYSSITAEFSTDMDMDEALQKVRERVDLARSELPTDAEDPMIMEFNMAEFPIMQVNVSGEYSLVQLKDVAEDLQDRLEQIPSILSVNLSGGLEREVKVDVDLPKLQFYELGFEDVAEAIAAENLTIPGGSIDVGNQKYLVRVDGEFADTRVIEDIVITTRDDLPIYIRDVATVDFGFEERASYARLNDNPVVTLDVVNRTGQNVIETADNVKATIDEALLSYPQSTVVEITSDMSEEIDMMVSSLENSIISGLILVLAVLLFFLGVRNASLVSISIPLSMLLSFIVMNVMGISMNMVVLFALILALGMLVDNAIVVVENIYRYKENGYDNVSAAKYATGEVALPIIASTTTTLAAFAPLMFWPDMVGEFMRFLPLTLIITLSSSLFVALVIVPVLAAMFVRIEGTPSRPWTRTARRTLIGGTALVLLGIGIANPLTAVLLTLTGLAVVALHRFVLARFARVVQNRFLPAMVESYERRLRWALSHRAVVIGAAVVTFVGAIALFGRFNAGVEFFPESIPPRTVYVQVDVPSGTNAAFTDEVAREIERRLPEVEGMSDARSVVATVRDASGGAANMFDMSGGGPGTVAVNFWEFSEREYDVFDTMDRLQGSIGEGIAGADVTVAMPAQGPPTGPPVNIEITGEDPQELRRLGDEVVAQLRASPVASRLEGLESDMTSGRPELVVEVDRERAALYGLSTREVGYVIRSAIQGTEAAKYRSGDDEYDIIVRLAEPFRQDLESLRHLTILHEERQIPLLSVATWRTEEGSSSVIRKDMSRVVTVSSEVRAGENSNAVLADVQTELASYADNLPPGYVLSYTGMQVDQMEAQEFLIGAFLAALMLIAFILISQFNSVVKPVIILTSVVMSTVGVFAGLVIFRMPFVLIMTGVGMITLAGVVVNNAIVLIDYIDILRERDGLTRMEALVQGGKTRFRPVVLTAVTTVLGLIPLAVGFNFEFIGFFSELSPELYVGGEQAAWWGSMAITVIVGLSFATVLTLVLVPVLYSLVDDFTDFFRRHYTHQDEDEATSTGQSVAPVRPEPRRPRRRRMAVQAFSGIRNRLLRPAEE